MTYKITFIVNEEDDTSFCYADSLKRARKIAKRMVDANYHYVDVERIQKVSF